MRIQEFGTNNGKSILCIPGLFMSGDCFRNLIRYLPEYHFVCVTLDAHHPDSEEFEGLEQEVSKLTQELKARELVQFDLVIGLSLGTILSVCLAERPGLSIKQLLLDGAVNFYISKSQFLEQAAMSALFHYFIRAAKKPSRFKVLDHQYAGDWAEYTGICLRSMTPSSLKVLIPLLSNFTPHPGLTQPISCLYGAKENNIAANQAAIRKCFPQARFSVIPGYNHLGFLNREPEKYAEIVRSMLE